MALQSSCLAPYVQGVILAFFHNFGSVDSTVYSKLWVPLFGCSEGDRDIEAEDPGSTPLVLWIINGELDGSPLVTPSRSTATDGCAHVVHDGVLLHLRPKLVAAVRAAASEESSTESQCWDEKQALRLMSSKSSWVLERMCGDGARRDFRVYIDAGGDTGKLF